MKMVERIKAWVRWVFAPGVWVSWSGLAEDEELCIGFSSNPEQRVSLSQAEGSLWIGVAGICWCPRLLRENPLRVSYRKGKEEYAVVLAFVPCHKYHIDIVRRQVRSKGESIPLVAADG
jgi:hypothetical protein